MKVTDEAIIEALIVTTTNKQAAEKCGLSESQFYARLRNENLQSKLADVKEKAIERASAVAQTRLSDAVATISEVMTDREVSAQTRVNAADALLRNAARLYEQTDILRRLKELEEDRWDI